MFVNFGVLIIIHYLSCMDQFHEENSSKISRELEKMFPEVKNQQANQMPSFDNYNAIGLNYDIAPEIQDMVKLEKYWLVFTPNSKKENQNKQQPWIYFNIDDLCEITWNVTDANSGIVDRSKQENTDKPENDDLIQPQESNANIRQQENDHIFKSSTRYISNNKNVRIKAVFWSNPISPKITNNQVSSLSSALKDIIGHWDQLQAPKDDNYAYQLFGVESSNNMEKFIKKSQEQNFIDYRIAAWSVNDKLLSTYGKNILQIPYDNSNETTSRLIQRLIGFIIQKQTVLYKEDLLKKKEKKRNMKQNQKLKKKLNKEDKESIENSLKEENKSLKTEHIEKILHGRRQYCDEKVDIFKVIFEQQQMNISKKPYIDSAKLKETPFEIDFDNKGANEKVGGGIAFTIFDFRQSTLLVVKVKNILAALKKDQESFKEILSKVNALYGGKEVIDYLYSFADDLQSDIKALKNKSNKIYAFSDGGIKLLVVYTMCMKVEQMGDSEKESKDSYILKFLADNKDNFRIFMELFFKDNVEGAFYDLKANKLVNISEKKSEAFKYTSDNILALLEHLKKRLYPNNSDEKVRKIFANLNVLLYAVDLLFRIEVGKDPQNPAEDSYILNFYEDHIDAIKSKKNEGMMISILQRLVNATGTNKPSVSNLFNFGIGK